MVTDPTWIWRDCQHCGTPFGQPDDPGRKRRFCSGACRTGAYRARKRRQEQADQRQRERHQQDRQANDDAWWRARERYQRHHCRSGDQPAPVPPRHHRDSSGV